ncbi:hypothetical protein [Congregibacter sp.]|uniref:hypothetical protein n=1 Tax=Congregibacter sp. TaxID=2744308 RepID=UPI00385F4B16
MPEVALLIGYDDPNSLYPAFRAWTGVTPQAVREGSRPEAQSFVANHFPEDS